MTPKDFIIREIKPKDNAEIAAVIRNVLVEFGVPKVGTAYEDKATDEMFENFKKEIFWIVDILFKYKVVAS